MSTTEPTPDTPVITMGQRADGTPWVIAVDFGDNVVINAYGTIWARGYQTNTRSQAQSYTAVEARQRAAALLAAADWVETGRSAKIEAAKAAKS